MGCLYKRRQKLRDGTIKEWSTWWIKYHANGRVVRESTGTRKETVARRILRAREGDVERGIPVSPKTGRITFEEGAEDLKNDYRINHRRSLSHVERRIDKHLAPFFRGRRLAGVTTADIRTYVRHRQEAGASNASVNRELAALKRMFSLALQASKLVYRPHMPMLQESNARTGFFEPEQFENVRKHLPAFLQSMVTFACLTGWRVPSEVLPLQWRQVDFRAGVVRLEPGTTKNDEGRVFPFDVLPELRTVLETQQQANEALKKGGIICPWVFHCEGEPIRDFRRAWRTACKAAGCPGRIPHDFRRTAVRNLVRAGVPEKTAMQLTGHKTRAIFDRYHIVNEADLREAVGKLARSVTGTDPGTVTGSEPTRHIVPSSVSA